MIDINLIRENAELVKANKDLFYTYDETTGIYEYKYWDARSRFDGEYYDESGNKISANALGNYFSVDSTGAIKANGSTESGKPNSSEKSFIVSAQG